MPDNLKPPRSINARLSARGRVMTYQVDIFHRKGEFVIFNDGTQAPITNWCDAWGDDCGPFDYPVSAVAGPDPDGKWHSIDIADFEPAKVN